MATQSATLTFSLPEDIDTDKIYIYRADTETGIYVQSALIDYEYGTTVYEYDSLDDTKWYKIRFYNSVDAEYGPYSEPVYGGNFATGAPFLAVSTTTDGSNYACIQDVYEYANLTTQDVTATKISKALKRARAVIDLQTAELDTARFDIYETEIARKKYNATLHILKEAEINISLGHLYRGLADDIIMERNRETTNDEPAITIGNTSISDTSNSKIQSVPHLMNLSNRYLSVGAAMLESIVPRSIRFTQWESNRVMPYFRYPFNGWK